MALHEKLILDKANALKSGNKQLNILLGTLLGELARKGKISTDDDCISAIKKMIDSCIECNELDEVKLLQTYMPTKLSDENLEIIISEFCLNNSIVEKRRMGEAMNYLKNNYTGQYDGKTASNIILKLLN